MTAPTTIFSPGRGPGTATVGSGNPLKISAAEEVLGEAWPGTRVTGIEVPSGVSHTPLTNEETIAGARERARAARARAGHGWGIGLEGGMARYAGRWFSGVWCAITDGTVCSVGGGVHFEIPPAIARRIVEGGEEMGPCLDSVSGIACSKRKLGAEGILTRGLIDRAVTFRTAIRYALPPFLRPEWYGRR